MTKGWKHAPHFPKGRWWTVILHLSDLMTDPDEKIPLKWPAWIESGSHRPGLHNLCLICRYIIHTEAEKPSGDLENKPIATRNPIGLFSLVGWNNDLHRKLTSQVWNIPLIIWSNCYWFNTSRINYCNASMETSEIHLKRMHPFPLLVFPSLLT